MGQKRALELILKHGSLEKVMQNIDAAKYGIPEPFPYQEARRLFQGACACLPIMAAGRVGLMLPRPGLPVTLIDRGVQ